MENFIIIMTMINNLSELLRGVESLGMESEVMVTVKFVFDFVDKLIEALKLFKYDVMSFKDMRCNLI